MTYKELTALVQLIGSVVIAIWVWNDFSGDGAAGLTMGAVAAKLLWAIGFAIVFNIVAMIVGSIIYAIFTRGEIKDEKDDERDRLIAARAGRNAYVIGSLAALAALIWLAFGADPAMAVYALFVAPFLAGASEALSRLVYYRIG